MATLFRRRKRAEAIYLIAKPIYLESRNALCVYKEILL